MIDFENCHKTISPPPKKKMNWSPYLHKKNLLVVF